MYFLEIDHGSWNLRTAFTSYSNENDNDFGKTCSDMKTDLQSIVTGKNMLNASQKRATTILDNWKIHVRNFRLWHNDILEVIPPSNKENPSVATTSSNTESNSTGTTIFNNTGGRYVNNVNSTTQSVNFFAEETPQREIKRQRMEAEGFFQQASASSTPDEPPLYLHERDLTSDLDGIGVFKLGDIDVSLKFKNFILASTRISRETGLLMESHPHHILALSNILLLKDNQHPPDLLEQFSQNELKSIIKHFKNKFVPGYNDLDYSQDAFHTIKSIIKKLMSDDISRGTAIKSLLDVEPETDPDERVILEIIMNCIKKLVPVDVADPLGEIDLCISYLDPVLGPLFTDYDKGLYLRWPNLKSKETEISESNVNKKRRPDAVVSQLVQDRFQESRAFGEAKAKERTKDVYELTRDLIRLGIFSKESIDVSNIDTVMSFQAVGDSICFYVTHLMVKRVYIMIEVAHITIPMSLSGLGDFLSKLDDLLLVKKCIDLAYQRPKNLPIAAWKAQTLSSPKFKAYVHSSRSVKRPTFIKF